MAVLNRRDYETAIPQLEKKFSDLSKYITVSDGQVQIKIEDLYGKVATLTVTTEEIDARVEDAEDNIGDLEVTAQAITQALTTKVTIFDSQPAPPYVYGDLWDKGNDGLYRCVHSRSNGSYTSSDWVQEDSTALTEITNRTMLIRAYSGGTITAYKGASYGVYTNASGSVDIVYLTWSGDTPSIIATKASYGTDIVLGDVAKTTAANMKITGSDIVFRKGSTEYGKIEVTTATPIGGSGTTSTITMRTGDGSIRLQDGALSLSIGGTYHSIVMTRSRLNIGDSSYPIYIYGSTVTADTTDLYSSGKVTAYSTIESENGRFVSTKTYETPGTQTNANLYVNGNGTIMKIASGSSKRYKYDIEDADRNTFDPRALYDIPFRQFRFKDGYFGNEVGENVAKKLRQGFVAEEVYEAYPSATVFEDGKIETWSERELIPPMLALIQEQNERIKELERKLA